MNFNTSFLKILIIEDDGIIAMDLKETLQEGGFEVVAIAKNLDQALTSVRKYDPDLALVDIRLEDSTRDGIETVRQILLIKNIPIIYLTASSEKQTFQWAKTTKPSAYLLKPFRSEELIFQIEMAIQNHQESALKSATIPSEGFVYLPMDKAYKKITTSEVLYLSAEGSYVSLFLLNKETPYLISTNLGNISQYFSSANFYRLSRSLIINLQHLDRVESNHIFMAGCLSPIRIPVSGRKELLNKLRVIRTKKS